MSLSLALALPVALAAAPAQAAKPAAIAVDRVTFPVTLSDGGTYTVVAYHYHRHGAQGRPLQVLVHGASYDHRYWDAGSVDGVNYSYARYMASRDYDVLAIDQLGAGESDKPFGYFLNLAETTSSVGQVLSNLRSPHSRLGHPSHRLYLVGHSNGSLTAIHEEAQNHLADGLVVTGWGHTYSPLPIDYAPIMALLQQPYIPATGFPPFLRAFLFFHLPQTAPAMLGYDASTLATTISSGQFLDTLIYTSVPDMDGVGAVTGPVLVQMGDHDMIAPGANAPLEAAHWASASSVTVQGLSEMGHDVNLHLNHEQSWSQIDAWLSDQREEEEDDCD
ncbi:MAG: alpha/beta hydrolase [Polyangiaceae bacterium]